MNAAVLMLVPIATVQQEVPDKRIFEQLIATRSSPRAPLKATVFVPGNNANQKALFRLAQMTADRDVAACYLVRLAPSERN